MRIRQVKPEFWKDRAMADLKPITRLTYVGLWMLADDAGYLKLEEPEVALELFGWDDRREREEVIHEVVEELVKAGRITRFECGHALIPTLTDHQRFGSPEKRVYTVQREHQSCPRGPAGSSGDPRGVIDAPERNGTVGGTVRNVKERQGSRASAENDGETEFQRLVPRSVIGGR